MNALSIKPTDFTPKVHFDPENSTFDISGFSRPENVIGFFRPVIKWLEEYKEDVLEKNTDFNKKLLTLNFKLTYFNSASSKFLLDILLEFMKFISAGYEVEVNWYYEDGDEEIQESGEEMSDMLSYPFKFISYTP